MLKDITVGRYVDTGSFLHKLDGRTKIICTLLFSIASLSCSTIIAIAVLAAAVLSAAAAARLPIRYVIKGLKPLRWLILFTIIFNIFTVKGNIIWQWHALSITVEGVSFALLTASRFILFVTGASILTLTTSPIDLTDALARLMRPLKMIKIPVDDIAMIMSVTLRFIPLFADEAERIMKAQRARGADLSSGKLLSRLRSVIPVTIPLFLSVFRKADELSLAMDSRCYGRGTRSSRKKSHIDANDLLFAGVLIIICGFLLIFEFYH